MYQLGISSYLANVEMGVPQGSTSTLGPLFFLLHINDMHRALSTMKNDSILNLNFKRYIDVTIQVIRNYLQLMIGYQAMNFI